MPIKITLEDGTTRELPDGFPMSQDELNRIITDRIGPKNSRISELKGQVQTLTSEKETVAAQAAEKDEQITTLTSQVGEKDRELLVTTVAHAKGVPAKWLRGDDKAALEASADEWLADARGAAGGAGDGGNSGGGGGAGDGGEGGQGAGPGGYVGSAGTGEEDPARPSFEERRQAAYERARKQQKGVLTS